MNTRLIIIAIILIILVLLIWYFTRPKKTSTKSPIDYTAIRGGIDNINAGRTEISSLQSQIAACEQTYQTNIALLGTLQQTSTNLTQSLAQLDSVEAREELKDLYTEFIVNVREPFFFAFIEGIHTNQSRKDDGEITLLPMLIEALYDEDPIKQILIDTIPSGFNNFINTSIVVPLGSGQLEGDGLDKIATQLGADVVSHYWDIMPLIEKFVMDYFPTRLRIDQIDTTSAASSILIIANLIEDDLDSLYKLTSTLYSDTNDHTLDTFPLVEQAETQLDSYISELNLRVQNLAATKPGYLTSIADKLTNVTGVLNNIQRMFRNKN